MAEKMSRLTSMLARTLAPLSDEEEQRAIGAALDHVGRNAEDARAGLLVYGAEVHVDKPPERGSKPPRQVRVLLGALAERTVYQVQVDGRGRVVASEARQGIYPAPVPSEIEMAEQIATQDNRVSRLARRPTVGTAAFIPGSPGDGARRIGLHYVHWTGAARAQPLATVVVNLSTGELESYRDDSVAASSERG